MGIDESGRSIEHRDAVPEQLGLRNVELVLDDLLDAEGKVGEGDVVLHPVVDAVDALVEEAGQVQHGLPHGLARNRAGVDAGAADDLAPLHERDLATHLGALDGRALAGRPRPDDDEIETVHRRDRSAGEDALSRPAYN